MKEYDKRWKRTYKKCNKQRRDRLKTLLKPKEKCCKCHYVKNKRGLKRLEDHMDIVLMICKIVVKIKRNYKINL